jgi:hypothetical protein
LVHLILEIANVHPAALAGPACQAESINAVLAIMREGDEVAYFACGVPVFVHAKADAP